jgi:pimeloyl-ACP methyl ester carboxylesterase
MIQRDFDKNKVKWPAGVMSVKPHFVLIHGIGGGSWCWYKLRCLMEVSGHKVTTLDLKGSGIDSSDPNSILTFDDYNSPLTEFLSSLPEDEKVILVGHSAGGLSVIAATHKFANKISLAVYICATMLKNGLKTEQDLKDGIPDLSEYGDIHEFGFGLGADEAPTSAMIKKEFQRKIIYNMSPEEDCTLAGMLLRPGPIVAIMAAQFGEGDVEDVEKVPRVYIKAEYDRVLKVEQQDAMIKRWPPANVYSLESDHSPFFSTPFLLCALLLKAAASLLYSTLEWKQS